jgi:hypothetical protein
MSKITGASERFVNATEIASSLIVDSAWVHAACERSGMPHRVIDGDLQFVELEVFYWVWDDDYVDPFDDREGDL